MKNTIKLGLCSAAALALASSAYATPTLYISDGTVAKVTVDEGAGDTIPGMAGFVGFSGAVGSWIVNVESGFVIGPSSKPEIDLSFNDLHTGAASSTLTLAFLSDGYSTALLTGLETIGGTLGTGATLSYSVYAQAGSTAGATMGTTAVPLASLNLAGWSPVGATQNFGPGGGYTGSQTGGLLPPLGGNPYELLQVVTITVPRDGGANNTSGDANFKVPDGSSTLMLLGSGLTALAFLRRAHKSKA